MQVDFKSLGGLIAVLVMLFTSHVRASDGPLPSWNDVASKQAILAFVAKITDKDSPGFVPVPDRIAVFDNDGTLWCEQPMYVQAAFVRDRIKAMAPDHPEWKQRQPFKALLENDRAALAASGEKGLVDLVTATHAGMTSEDFASLVRDWIATATHPRFDRPYTTCVYQPMLELLAYLRANGFQTFIVSGGGVEFMRVWAESVYGIAPNQVVGSTVKMRYELRGETPVLMRLPEVDFIDDHAGKPVSIGKFLGKKPIAAFGNSDGDQQMLEWTQGGSGARLMMLVHHDDAAREWAYGPDSKIGTFSDALMAEAKKNAWTVISMKDDWKKIFVGQ